MDLQGAKVLITGGSKGLGKATAKLLKEAGAKVLISARGEQTLKAAADEIGVHFVQADAGKKEDIEKMFKVVDDQLGGLDVLVNNAGIGGWSTIDNLDMDTFQKVFNVNVFGAAMVAEQAAKRFIAQKSGNIINIASTAALKGFAQGTIYVASKFALRGMTQCWQQELRKHNIRVIEVNPSEVPTAFGQENGEERALEENKLSPMEIAHTIKSVLEMDNRGYIPEVTVHATNPF